MKKLTTVIVIALLMACTLHAAKTDESASCSIHHGACTATLADEVYEGQNAYEDDAAQDEAEASDLEILEHKLLKDDSQLDTSLIPYIKGVTNYGRF
jgi:hypothetical protein